MPRVAPKEGYSRRHRFTVQGSFGPVLRSARKLHGRYAIIHAARGRENESRLGIALTRRLVPRSVDRNLVKRMVRDAFRRHDLKCIGLDCVVTLRERFDAAAAAALLAEIRGHFEQLAKTESR